MKMCPFLNQSCLKEKCQLWIKTNKDSDCAIAAFPLIMGDKLSHIENNIHRLAGAKRGGQS